jgi:two-component system CheB/CheR fusion protein
MEELWGVRADEVHGKPFLTLDIGMPIDQLAAAIRSSLSGGEETERVLDCTNRRGRPVRCRVSVTPLKTEPRKGVTVVVDELAPS